jgi:hypothetical protein
MWSICGKYCTSVLTPKVYQNGIIPDMDLNSKTLSQVSCVDPTRYPTLWLNNGVNHVSTVHKDGKLITTHGLLNERTTYGVEVLAIIIVKCNL